MERQAGGRGRKKVVIYSFKKVNLIKIANRNAEAIIDNKFSC